MLHLKMIVCNISMKVMTEHVDEKTVTNNVDFYVNSL